MRSKRLVETQQAVMTALNIYYALWRVVGAVSALRVWNIAKREARKAQRPQLLVEIMIAAHDALT